MSHNRKLTRAEAKTVEEFALFIRWVAQANNLQASLYLRALLKAQMDLTAALIDVAKPVLDAAEPDTKVQKRRKKKRR